MKFLFLPTWGMLLPVMLVNLVTAAHASELACQGQFDGKTARLIVPFQVGGGYDIYARVFAPHYQEITGAKLVVENRPEGGGLVGVRKVMDAAPDGLTIGLLNGPKRTLEYLLSNGGAPNILTEFSILARIARSQYVLLVGGESGIEDIGSLINRSPPPVFGGNNLRTGGFMSTLLAADLLKMEFDVVTGLGGTRKRVLAAVRGDVDMVSSNFHSVYSDIEAGTIRPVLQISNTPISDHPSLVGVPLLGGSGGLAALRAAELGLDIDNAINTATAIDNFTGTGRLFVAPANLPDELANCLQDAFYLVLRRPDFIQDIGKVNLTLDIASGPAAQALLEASLPDLQAMIPLIRLKINEL